MKKTLTTVAMLLLALLVGSVSLPTISSFSQVVSSQADVQPDVSSTKGYYDFALTSLGERSLEQIAANMKQDRQSDMPIGLFQTYMDYKEALGELAAPTTLTVTAADLEQLHLQLLELQNQYFTLSEAELLFTEENTLRQLAIEKAQLAESALSELDKAAILEQYIDELPDYIKKAERNNNLVTDLVSMDGLDQQQKLITRTQLVGEAAAHRLAELDEQRASFQTTFDNYITQRGALLNSQYLSDQEKEQQIASLREKTFPSNQLRRIEALERIHDTN